ncbi:MAG TPA: A/G-specific adenine glycosylase [Crenotrichaceae bacterium]|nr:A/G-specific adenine glycosylase [Crenotrichaceae bacterium]
MTAEVFQHSLLDWYDCHGRKDLPWQSKPANAYAIWVSEIMLQQTQVSVVIPYFQRFMTRFPTVQALASASLDRVLEHWAGLGYYARARNLHKTAQIINTDYAGQFPAQLDVLCRLPGIGRSTAAAILSMAFSQRHAILDGNVKRVLARFYGIQGWPGKASVSKQLWQLSDDLTPPNRVADYTQAIMDLGATLCTRRNPECTACPVASACVARITKRIEELPTPRKQQAIPVKHCYMAVLLNSKSDVYLQKRAASGIWGGLWSLPEHADKNSVIEWFQQRLVDKTSLKWLPVRKHTFSHFHLHFQPVLAQSGQPHTISEFAQSGWFKPDQSQPAMPAPIQKLLSDIL